MIAARPRAAATARAGVAWIALCVVMMLAPAPRARAHAELESSSPAAQSRVDVAPKRVALEFTEPPTDEGVLRIRDGCRRNVTETARVSGKSLRANIGFAQPGAWRVRYTVVSKVDGHVTRGTFAFRVKGKRDCSAQPGENRSEAENGTSAERAFGEEGDPSDEGSGIPWVVAALGSAALVGGALLVRRLSSR